MHDENHTQISYKKMRELGIVGCAPHPHPDAYVQHIEIGFLDGMTVFVLSAISCVHPHTDRSDASFHYLMLTLSGIV